MAENLKDYVVNSNKEIRYSVEDGQYKNQIPVIDCGFKFRSISLLEFRNICKTI